MKWLLVSCCMLFLLKNGLMSNGPVDQDFHKKIGEMLIVGFDDNQFHEKSMIAEDIEQYHVGGVILFASWPGSLWEYKKCSMRNVANPEQLRELIEKLQDHAKKSRKAEEGGLFIGIDQEGGWVNRLSEDNGFEQENLSAKELGEKNDFTLTYKYAQRLGGYLNKLGINLNFAPVVDLSVNLNNFIYKRDRCFGNDSSIVYEQASFFAKGMHENGIRTALKHFPGHGNSADDTHRGMVDVTGTWSIKELEPYQKFIEAGYDDMIMISHVINRQLDSVSQIKNKSGEVGLMPATFSRKMVTELLREKMGFKGVIVSDDLCMGAIANEYSFEDTLKHAINSGIDMLILANHAKDLTKDAVETIQRLVDSGEVKKERIDESYRRIMQLKLGHKRKRS